MADKNDPIGYAKYVRGLASTERLLRQFLKTETGLGKNPAYSRGHDFNFTWSQADRDIVNHLMTLGMTFEEAFDFHKRELDGRKDGNDGSSGADSAQ